MNAFVVGKFIAELRKEKSQKEADKNIIDVMKSSKQTKNKWQIIALVLSLITFFTIGFGFYKFINTPKEDLYNIEITADDSKYIFSEISDALYLKSFCSDETVVTESRIQYDADNSIKSIDMELWDSKTLKFVKAVYGTSNRKENSQLVISVKQYSEHLDTDGIPLSIFAKLLTEHDISEIVELSGNSCDNGYTIDFDSRMFKTIEENSNVEVGPHGYSYLYADNQIVPFTNLNQTSGKLFEIAVFLNVETEHSFLNESCCLINVPR